MAWLIAMKMLDEFAEKHTSTEQQEAAKAETASSQAFYSLNYFKDCIPYMGIEALDFMFKARKLQAVNSLIVAPPKAGRRIDKAIKKHTRRMRRTKDLHHSIYIIACLVDDIAKETDWISNTIDYGISLKVDGEILLMSIHADTETIKSTYMERGDFFELMMIKGVITPQMKGSGTP